MTRHLIDCTACAWYLPARGAFGGQVEADHFIHNEVLPHVTATGHTVRLTVFTRTGDLVERTSFLYRPEEGGPAPDQ